MKVRNAIKLGNSVAVTIPSDFGIAAGDSVVVSLVQDGTVLIAKVREVIT